MGLFCGLGYGLAQDGMKLLQGQRVAYVDFILGRRQRRDIPNIPNTQP